jgi:hypothetical protein
MTREEFRRSYIERSRLSPADVARLRVERCACDYEGCQGWRVWFDEPEDA